MNIKTENGDIILTDAPCFALGATLDCGQAFRWSEVAPGTWHGVAGGVPLTVEQRGCTVRFFDTPLATFERLWLGYFDLERDYAEICKTLCEDEQLRRAVEFCPGIRILHQEPWEALCSFIISQNNNIPRIKGIIGRLCESFGEDTGNGFTFPCASRIAGLTAEQLSPLRAGFRAKYIIDAARKVTDGTVELEKIKKAPPEFGREELQKITGVGAKVAECTLLYGFHKLDAFPVDVWVRRLMGELYPEGLPECTAGIEGIAQQYLFHYRRIGCPQAAD